MAATKVCSILCLVLLYSAAAAYRWGFSKDQCDNMDPTETNTHSSNEEAAGNGTTEEPLPQLELDTDPSHFVIEASMAKYKRARPMTFFINGPMSAVLLQVRQHSEEEDTKPVLVGEFKSWPESLKPLQCNSDKNTALTNKDLQPKSNVSVTWNAPPEDVGDVHLMGTFVQDGMYWLMVEGPPLSCDDFPVSLSSCGKMKSCYLHSDTPSCHADTCDYILTYKVVDNNRSVEFVLGGLAKDDHCYLGIGFSQEAEVNNMSFIACSKYKGETEVNYYIVQEKDGDPMEQSMPFESTKIDVDGDRLWCSFTIPLSTPGEQSLDLSVPQYHLYLTGHTKEGVPILPRTENMLKSEDDVNIEELKATYHLPGRASLYSSSAAIVIQFALLSTALSWL